MASLSTVRGYSRHSGKTSAGVFTDATGRTISSLEVISNRLIFHFYGGGGIVLSDEGQECCEDRYMTCDDDLTDFIGARLIDAEVREGPTTDVAWDGLHEIAFLVVTTSSGVFTVASHNEHNGYYGGFDIEVTALDEEAN